ncbi:hypothetical protein CAEBREN_06874 [Caenorhabditis brenneri]|uniref:Uncharacterized protein n=1 Tax=Caenorhabditis brenneri TaxID=135651 RepID=G0MAT5_CAEBE|nr:hypothetical protein CAEBREN_06874 [Caenorhabditis brenneri]
MMDQCYEVIVRHIAKRVLREEKIGIEEFPEKIDEKLRNKLVADFKALCDVYGKNFPNLFHEVIGKHHWFQGPNLIQDKLLLGVSMEKETENFRWMTFMINDRAKGELLQEVFGRMNATLSEMDDYTKKIGTSTHGVNWHAWSSKLERQCREYNLRYPPGAFRDQLYKFLTPVHNRIIFGVDEETAADYMKDFGDRTACWEALIQQVEHYKQHYFCGFVYGVLDFWLTNKVELILGPLPPKPSVAVSNAVVAAKRGPGDVISEEEQKSKRRNVLAVEPRRSARIMERNEMKAVQILNEIEDNN